MPQLYKNAEVLLPDGFHTSDVLVDNGVITRIGDMNGTGVDLSGRRLLPGLVDIHTHGGGGFDFNSAKTESELESILDHYGAHGVTTVMATLMTDRSEVLERQLEFIAGFASQHPMVKGIHLEGPFLSTAYKGAMPEALLKQPDLALFHRYQEKAKGLIRYLTVSPELAGAEEFIRAVTSEGVKVSLGHSGADFGSAMKCVEAGAVCFTHVFNAMRPIDHHSASIAVAALTADTCCEAILDGKHLAPEMVRMLFTVKGPDKLIGVTDSLAVAGMPDGQYLMAGTPVRKTGGDVRLISDGTRAGSALNGFDALKNLMRFAAIPLEQAISCMTRNPLRMLSLYEQTGSIVCGKAADFIVTDGDALIMTVCGGQVLYDERSQ